ncbi:MAG: type II toxin-antitoxin system VapC family toxin [Bifidobacteriaceae bacterium]|jgi:PIN domain nuclease of toxin-antitoxin system|nr:type II toxin-antitoxin system VapC family toxin [Bifidobacteriaceae bacterium]
MKVLLDTHAVLWAARAPERLGPAARAVIERLSTKRLVSDASCWELGIKFAKGKLPEAQTLLERWDELLASLAAAPLAVGTTHALLAPRLDWGHPDPFDRVLAAQAITEGAVFVSRDAAFDAVEGLERIW